MSRNYGRSANSSASQWFLHRITGTFLIFLLIAHFWVQHYDRTTASISHSVITRSDAEAGVLPDYSDEADAAVQKRRLRQNGNRRNPVVPAERQVAQPSVANATPHEVLMLRLGDPVYAVLWKGFNLLFLLFALHHGFYGVTNVLSDYIRHDMLRVGAVTVAWLLALALFIIGAYSVVVAGLSV